ncbi:octopamine receptor beta-2R-like [Ptychodera flava]|uniref:octopamine receptor beta-2R-like n=1 Tax=Ptychodera flava TaxID=63121 RepID=UPI00396A5253
MMENASTLNFSNQESGELTFNSQHSTTGQIFIGFALSVMTLFIVAGNVLVVLSLVKFGNLHQKLSRFLILNLAFSDLVIGVLIMPFRLHRELVGGWIFGHTFCVIWFACDAYLAMTCLYAVLLISVEKYMYVTMPLKYSMLVTKPRLQVAILSSWIFCGLVTLMPIVTGLGTTPVFQQEQSVEGDCYAALKVEYVSLLFGLNVLLPTVVMFYTNYHIYKAVREQTKKIHAQRIGPPVKNHSRPITKSEIKAIKMMFIMVFLAFVMWFPALSVLFINSLCSCIHPVVSEITIWFGISQTALHPFLYTYKKEFRQAYMKILKCNLRGSLQLESTVSVIVVLPVSQSAE